MILSEGISPAAFGWLLRFGFFKDIKKSGMQEEISLGAKDNLLVQFKTMYTIVRFLSERGE